MPKGNSGAYKRIDQFLATLDPEEQRYLYGAIEAMIDMSDAETPEDTAMEQETGMEEPPGEMPADSKPEDDEFDYEKEFGKM